MLESRDVRNLANLLFIKNFRELPSFMQSAVNSEIRISSCHQDDDKIGMKKGREGNRI